DGRLAAFFHSHLFRARNSSSFIGTQTVRSIVKSGVKPNRTAKAGGSHDTAAQMFLDPCRSPVDPAARGAGAAAADHRPGVVLRRSGDLGRADLTGWEVHCLPQAAQ